MAALFITRPKFQYIGSNWLSAAAGAGMMLML